MRIACYQPEIAGNTGAVLRLSACLGVGVDIIEPCGFIWSAPRMKRAGMDYIQHVDIVHHASWHAFRESLSENTDQSIGKRAILLTTHAKIRLPDFTFAESDTLILGRESAGVPAEVAESCDAAVRIPIAGNVRSLNLAVAAAIALYEARRQTGGLPQ